MHRDARLPGQVLQQSPIRGGEALARSAGSQRDFTQLLAVIDEWEVDELLLRDSIGGSRHHLPLLLEMLFSRLVRIPVDLTSYVKWPNFAGIVVIRLLEDNRC